MLRYFLCIFVVSSVNSLCRWPCQWLESSVYNNYYGVVNFPDANTATAASGTSTCQESQGQFYIIKIEGTDLYTCFKLNEVNPDTIIINQTPPDSRKHLFHNPIFDFQLDQTASYASVPSICEICTPDGFAAATPGMNPQIAIRQDLVEFGCNVPKNCPAEGGDECSGHEKNIPDTSPCNGRRNRKRKNRYNKYRR